MNEFLYVLSRASLFMAVTGFSVMLFLRIFQIKSPAFHRIAWGLVIVQGLMLGRFGFELPILAPEKTVAGNARIEVAEISPLREHTETHISVPHFFETEISETEIETEPEENFIVVPEIFEQKTLAANDLSFGIISETEIGPTTESEATIESQESYFADVPVIFFGLWGIGMAVAVLLQAGSYFISLAKLRNLRPLKGKFRQEWNELLVEHKIKRGKVRIYVSEKHGPWLVRTFRGYLIIVPEKLWEEADSRHRAGILRHELSHYRHRDLQKSFFLRIIASMHWFNPVGWLAIRKFEEAAEWRCDADAFAKSEKGVADFAETLLVFRDTVPLAGLYRGAFITKGKTLINRVERLIELQQSKGDSKMKKGLLILAALTIIGLGLFEFELTARSDSPSEQPAVAGTVAEEKSDNTPYQIFSEQTYSQPDDERVFRAYEIAELIEDREDGAKELIELICTVVAPDSWGQAEGALIAGDGKKLLIYQTREIHDDIATLLAQISSLNELRSVLNNVEQPTPFIPVRDKLNIPTAFHTEEPITAKEAFDRIGRIADINISFDEPALKAVGISLDEKVSLQLKFRVPVKFVLDYLCKSLGLGWKEFSNGIFVTSKKNSETMVTKTYYIGDLLGSCSSSQPQYDQDVPVPANPYSLPYIPNEVLSENYAGLRKLITTLVEPDSWGEEDGARGDIIEYYNTLSIVVRNSEAVHTKIAELLNSIRKCHNIQIMFKLESIALDESAFEQSAKGEHLLITAFNGQPGIIVLDPHKEYFVKASPKSSSPTPLPHELTAKNKPFCFNLSKGKSITISGIAGKQGGKDIIVMTLSVEDEEPQTRTFYASPLVHEEQEEFIPGGI